MKYLFFTVLLGITGFLTAQKNNIDEVYLKDGRLIQGNILKNTDSIVSISTSSGTFEYKHSEIAEITEHAKPIFVTGPPGVVYKNIPPGNALWLGLNFEPEIQCIFKNKRSYSSFIANNPGLDYKYPVTGGLLAGFTLYYQAAKTVGFETGLQYHFYQSAEAETKVGYTQTYKALNKFHNLEIPVLINLHTNGGRIRFYTSDGLDAGITMGIKHVYGFVPGKQTIRSSGVDSSTSFYCMLVLSAGVQIGVSENLAVNISTIFRIASNTEFGAANPLYSRGYTFIPYSIGLNVAILFRTLKNKNKPAHSPKQPSDLHPFNRL